MFYALRKTLINLCSETLNLILSSQVLQTSNVSNESSHFVKWKSEIQLLEVQF